MEKRILGLDLGTNSIGWALVKGERHENDNETILSHIEAAGSRILPLDAAAQGDFEKGNPAKTQTSERTRMRGMRHLLERSLLRRERLHRVLDIMDFLPPHYSQSLTRYGKFKADTECKLAWRKTETGHYEFLFQDSFQEMLQDFQSRGKLEDNKKIPYDWTIYYLRKKALTQPVSKQELAWILLNFNQKRGYYQREDQAVDDNQKKRVEYQALKVISVEDTGEKKGKNTWYAVHLENGLVYHYSAPIKPDWKGETKEFIVTTTIDQNGKPELDKDGNPKYSMRAPKEDDYKLLMEKTKKDITDSGKSVGEYIYDALLVNPQQKIRGGLVRTIERYFYKKELEKILLSQERFIPELTDREIYRRCVEELYPSNDAYRHLIESRDMRYLLVEDILFYQRPLKSKKSLIDDCPYESRSYVDRETGEIKSSPVKCIAQSHPLFQEFRLWQFIHNLRIYQNEKSVEGKLQLDVDVTEEVLPTPESKAALFRYLNDRENVTQEILLKEVFKGRKLSAKDCPYRWNYAGDGKKYPCNETRHLMLKLLKKAGIDTAFLTPEKEQALWHIMYSVEDKDQYEKALSTFARKNDLPDGFKEQFKKAPTFKKDYGAYSLRAIKKLLPLMRVGEYWSADCIDSETKERISQIIRGEMDEKVSQRMTKSRDSFTDISQFQALPVWLACYVVYGRHSEATEIQRWEKPEDIDVYLKAFKQHSLRNPIVEQVVLETLRVVRDIWKTYGKVDEIHIEMGRDMKNTAEERKRIFNRNQQNENDNLRIKALLTEFMNPDFEIEGVRPYSPSQQEALRIYEDGAWSGLDEEKEDKKELEAIREILGKFSQSDKAKRPTHSEVLRYKAWLEQRYSSPYTGEAIPLAKLFTPAYEIEHVIPQSRFFDDSFSNKVVCEAEVNKLKDRMLGYEFIKAHQGEAVSLSGTGRCARILSPEEYEQRVTDCYKHNTAKMKKLLMEEIPDDFIQRQMNDSRYISKLVKSLLSNMVREEGEREAISKHVITCNGTITDRLKKDWGVNDVWNHIILPRFQRMKDLTGRNDFVAVNSQGHEIPSVPPELQKGFKKKRIDHRHHAMDAIVIACTTRNHVNLLNNEAAMSENKANRIALSRKLRRYENCAIYKGGETKNISVAKEFLKPWATFPADVERALGDIVVSFKQNLRVINKATNHYEHYKDGKKVKLPQVKGDMWAVRKPMHKDTVFALVNLRQLKTVGLKDAILMPDRIANKDLKQKVKELLAQGDDLKKIKKYFETEKDTWRDVDIKKIEVYYFSEETANYYYATRKPLDANVKIDTVTDTGIQKILRRHLEENGNKVDVAFSPEGIARMNENIFRLNGNKRHQPIYKVRVFEKANKYPVGQRGNKSSKFVEAAKGTNLYLAIYENEAVDKKTAEISKKRSYEIVPLRDAVAKQKQGMSVASERNEEGRKLLFVLSPKDFVYVPTEEERSKGEVLLPLDKSRIYIMTDSDGSVVNFLPYSAANLIYALPKDQASDFCADGRMIQNEFGLGSPKSKNERALTGEMIKEVCIPIKVDRLGHITEINGNKV